MVDAAGGIQQYFVQILGGIEGIAQVARRAGVPLIVDNTLATPYLCRPFEHGADIVVHSATKFLGGHGNSIGGVIVDGGSFNWMREGRYPTLSEPCESYQGMVLGETFGNFAFAIACRVLGLRDLGPALSPFNAFLILTGIETLALRMDRHCSNTVAVAEFLSSHPKVAWVSYSGRPGDRYRGLRQKYCRKGGGAVFTFGVKGGYDAGVKVVSNVQLFSHLANIGDTRSLMCHPASTTHAGMTQEARDEMGVTEGLLRINVGLEDVEDVEGNGPLEKADATSYRALAARENYPSQDRPDLQFAAREVCRDMATPSSSSWGRLKRLARYLLGHPRLIWKSNKAAITEPASWASTRAPIGQGVSAPVSPRVEAVSP